MQQTSLAFAHPQGVPQNARQGLAPLPLRQKATLLCMLLQQGRGLAAHQLQGALLFPSYVFNIPKAVDAMRSAAVCTTSRPAPRRFAHCANLTAIDVSPECPRARDRRLCAASQVRSPLRPTGGLVCIQGAELGLPLLQLLERILCPASPVAEPVEFWMLGTSGSRLCMGKGDHPERRYHDRDRAGHHIAGKCVGLATAEGEARVMCT